MTAAVCEEKPESKINSESWQRANNSKIEHHEKTGAKNHETKINLNKSNTERDEVMEMRTAKSHKTITKLK